MTTNQAQRDQWNAESQATTWPRRERVSSAVTAPLLDALALTPGERVLEVGSGGGLAAMAAARAVGGTGHVTGFDLSGPLVRLAVQRAAEAKVENVTFVVGDAQTDAIPGAPFDVVMSQFGVMFFADPVAAFSNIRKHMRAGGRMAFACWQPAPKNAWFPGAVLATYQPPPPPRVEGAGPPPGPFAFGDPKYVETVLRAAGFGAIVSDAFTLEVVAPADSLFDRDLVDGLKLDPERAAQALKDLEAFQAQLIATDGQLHLSIAPQIFRARNPE
jgi:SAM-dependent methyltransferase